MGLTQQGLEVPATEPLLVGCLLVPARAADRTVGVLWVAAHDAQHPFDAEDARRLTGLSHSAAMGWQLQRRPDVDEARPRTDEFLATLAHELRNPLAPSAARWRQCVP